MLLIRTSEQDASTNDVLDWLYFLAPDIGITRINDEQTWTSVSYSLSNDQKAIYAETSHEQKAGTMINASWYRRGRLSVHGHWQNRRDTPGKLSAIGKSLAKHLSIETEHINEAIDMYWGSFPGSINKFIDNRTNKIANLAAAVKVGLKIPATLITNDIADLLQFCTRWHKIITKATAYNRCTIPIDNKTEVILSADTKLMTVKDVKKLAVAYKDKKPLPALYQQYINKEIELRIFFLHGTCYTMAIFSQNDAQTRIDFRNYNIDRPNRCTPYCIPENIHAAICRFMKAIDMNCGSLDMIVTPEGEYVFLEVNPVGQYQWLERNCNYPISKNIAQILITDV